jgi:hypothetical protein
MPKVSKKHPENLKDVNSIKTTPELESFVVDLASQVETERANRSVWESNIDKAINLRYGIRNKKTTPWVGCANFVVPLIDTHINNNKVAYVNLLNSNPIVTFEPYGSEDVEPARKREVLFDWRMKSKVKFFEPYNYGVDIALEQGVVIFKVIWKFTTNQYTEYIDLKDFDAETLGALYDERVEDKTLMKILEEEHGIDMTYQENFDAVYKAVQKFREGATQLTLDLVETKDDQPEVTACSLREDIILPINTESIQDALFIDHQFYRSINDLKKDMLCGKYAEYKDETIESWAGGFSWKSKSKGNRIRISAVDDQMVLIHETCCWYDVNNDGIDERCVCTYPDANPSQILRFIEVPYDHGLFPYAMVKRELNSRGAYASRGYPYIDEDYQVGISKALNQAIDNGDIVNTPKVVYKKNCVSNVKNARYTPAEPVEIVNGQTTDYEIRQVGNLSQGVLFQQAQFLKAWADQRIGNVQSSLTDPTNLAGQGLQGQRTAKEVTLMASMAGGLQSLDLVVWQMQMAEVYFQIDALYDQFGNDEEEVVITGEAPIKVNRREIQGKFHIIPNGRLENTDPMMRAMKTFNLMRIFAGDEDIKQSELKKIYLMDYDPRIAKKIMLTQEEMAQRDGMKQQITQKVKGEQQSDMINMKRIANALDVQKELMLSKIPRREIVVDYNDDDDGEKKTKSHNKSAKVTYGKG